MMGLFVITQADRGRVSGDDQKRVCFRETRSQGEHVFKNLNRPTRE